MRNQRRLLFFLMLLAAAPLRPAFAQGAEEANTAALADALMEVSGLGMMLDQVPAGVEASLAARADEMPPEVRQALAHAMESAFGAEVLRADAAAALRDGLQADRARAVIAWWREPLPERMRALDVASVAVTDEALQAFAARLDGSSPAFQERVELSIQYLRGTNALDMTMESIVAITKAIARGINQTQPEAERTSDAALDAAFDGMREQYAEPLAQSMVVRVLYSYRDVPTDELAAYLSFFETDLGRWYTSLMFKAFDRAFQGAGERMGAALVRSLE